MGEGTCTSEGAQHLGRAWMEFGICNRMADEEDGEGGKERHPISSQLIKECTSVLPSGLLYTLAIIGCHCWERKFIKMQGSSFKAIRVW